MTRSDQSWLKRFESESGTFREVDFLLFPSELHIALGSPDSSLGTRRGELAHGSHGHAPADLLQECDWQRASGAACWILLLDLCHGFDHWALLPIDDWAPRTHRTLTLWLWLKDTQQASLTLPCTAQTSRSPSSPLSSLRCYDVQRFCRLPQLPPYCHSHGFLSNTLAHVSELVSMKTNRPQKLRERKKMPAGLIKSWLETRLTSHVALNCWVT